MAIEAERLILYLDARLGDYDRAMSKARRDTDRTLREMERRFQTFGRTIGGALGVGLSVGGFLAIGRDALRMADDLDDTSKQLGVTTTQLQAMRFAARETGLEVGQLDAALDAFSRSVGDAATGNEQKIEQFKALGINIHNASGELRSISDLSIEAAQKISALSNRTQQVAAATDLFGRGGARLLPLLKDLAGGWDTVTAAAEAAGQVMSEESVKALGDAADEIERFKNRVTIAVGNLIGDLRRMFDGIQDVDELVSHLETVRKVQGGTGGFGAAFGIIGKAFEPILEGQLGTAKNVAARREEALGMFGAASQSNLSLTYDPQTTKKTGGGTSAAQKAADARAEALRQLADELELNKQLIATFGEGEAALAMLRTEYEALAEARKLGLEAGTAEHDQFVAGRVALEEQARQLSLLEEGAQVTAELRTEEEKRVAVLTKLNELRDAGAITEETYRLAVQQTTEQYRLQEAAITELQQFGEQAFDRIGAAITQTFVSGEGAAIDFLGIVKGVLAEILQEMIKLAILNPLKNAIFGGLPGFQNLPTIFDLFSGGSVGGFQPGVGNGGFLTFGGPRARGGRVEPGKWYDVGEMGREKFVPDVPGAILPNGWGEMSVVIHNAVPDTSIRQRRRRNGGRAELELFFDTTIASQLGRRGSQSNDLLEAHGGRSPLVRRS